MNQDRGVTLIKALLDRPIAFHRPLVRVTGSVNAALFVSQLMYWTPRGDDPDGWIYKTQIEWEEETGLKPAEQRTIRKEIGPLGLRFLEERLKGVPARLYYRINLMRLRNALAAPDSSYPSRGEPAIRDAKGKYTAKRTAISETTTQRTQTETTSTGARAAKNRPTELTDVIPRKISKIPKKPTPNPLVAGFDRLWAVIPKRISKGRAKVEAWEAWKSLTPPPTKHCVAEMVRLVKVYLKESPGGYEFYDADGSVLVTPAALIARLCQAMNEGLSLGEVLEHDVQAGLLASGGAR